MKLWGGRFQKETDRLVEDFHSSISFDQRLYKQDIRGSIAHARMLGKIGVLTQEEADTIIAGLQDILKDIEAGQVEFEIGAEDIHMNIEKLLTARVGEVGKKLHTARSRNDQVALDTRLFVKEEIQEICQLILKLQEVILNLSEAHLETVMPGYTHLQKAQPITFAHHLMAYFQMLQRDYERFQDCLKRADVMPLGSGALAGTTFPLDRQMVAEELGFAKITLNSLDGVSDRDYIIELASAASILMMHFSRLCEEIILWSSDEFRFIDLDDAYSTGSSIMPQKKNPDVAELIRGKTGRVYGHLMGLLTMMKSLPLAYNKDMQEDKEALFDTVDTVKKCLMTITPMLQTMKVNKERMAAGAKGGFTNATDVADYLAKKGVPFREAHAIVGRLVLKCVQEGRVLEDLTLEEYKYFSPVFAEDIYTAISIQECVSKRNVPGGPAKEAVLASIDAGKKWLEKNKQ
ncbi:argininosuccinate lyase [Zhaonella formicivorans]|jgi:argininosuccinate lyase|uniref:argininosuccinate lyase n=1 Tax=Zhaonella formicivorans TaxID=2528593 RepID=UPI0010EE29D8|nr:argininosuccinate lyase [Zhaonella formicivorans]